MLRAFRAELSEGSGSRVRIALNNVRAVFHRPHPRKETDKGAVKSMMQDKGYLARIEFDNEANIFHGEVINIPDVITFQGESVEKLKNAFVDSVEDYLKFCAARGEQPEEPFSGRFTVRLSPDQHSFRHSR